LVHNVQHWLHLQLVAPGFSGILAIDLLSLFGLFAVTCMLVTYALEPRSAWFVLDFAGFCILGFRLRISAGRMVFWDCRSGLVDGGRTAMVSCPWCSTGEDLSITPDQASRLPGARLRLQTGSQYSYW
jgi:hypothetical protein